MLSTLAQSGTQLAIEGASQGYQSTDSDFQDLKEFQGRSSLTSHIEANDTLPVDWNPFKRRRLSQVDIIDLQDRLELDHNIRQIEPRRPSELDASTLIDADLQRRYNKPSTVPRLARNLQFSPFFRNLLRWTQDTSRTLSTGSKLRQRRIADQISSSNQWLSDSMSGLLTAMFFFLCDFTMTAGKAWKMG